MSIVSSNMISKHYCPQCNSFDLLKLHRGFVQKRILGTENKLQCRACGEVFKPGVFDKNIPLEVPVFLDTAHPTSVHRATAETVEDSSADTPVHEEIPVVVTNGVGRKDDEPQLFHSSKALEDDLNLADDSTVRDDLQMPEDDFKVTETVLPRSEEVVPATRNSNPNKSPPLHNGDEQLVDETILLNEKKGIWPYVLGSLVVMFGAAYAFIWMPVMFNDKADNIIQMDMTIGEPVRVMAQVKQTELVSENKSEAESLKSAALSTAQDSKVKLDEPLEVSETDVNKAVETEFQLAGASLQKADAESRIIDLDTVKKPLTALTKTTIEKPKVRSPKLPNPRLVADLGTKADIALGGLSSDSRADKAVKTNPFKTTIAPFDVPLPLTVVRQDKTPSIASVNTGVTAEKSEIARVKTVGINSKAAAIDMRSTETSSIKLDVTKKPSNEVVKVSSAPVQSRQPPETIVINKRAAAVLGVSAKDLTALAGIAPKKPVKLVQPAVVKKQKRQASNANTQLLEKVAVKFMQQDLDKLLPN